MRNLQEGFIKDTYETFIKEAQTILTVSYVLAIGIGMLFTYHKYSIFEINIFDYADVFDFLIAPFSDYRIFLFTLISLGAAYLILKFDVYLRTRHPVWYSKANFGWDNKGWFNIYRYATFALLGIFYLNLAGSIYAKISRKNILAKPTTNITYSDNEVKTGKMIGKTKDVIFLWTEENVAAIPITSLVKEIKIP